MPRIMEGAVEVVRVITQERVSHVAQEQIVDVPACTTGARAELYSRTDRGCASAPDQGERFAARTTGARAELYSGTFF